MTSTSQQTQIPPTASNTSSVSQSTQSYASATKKAVSSPPIATGSSTQSPAVAVGNTAPVQSNAAKPSSISPVNGRAAIPPAVPAMSAPPIAHSSSGPINGNPSDHGRKSSVTISANGGYIPNGGPVGGQKAGIPQFGSITDSPASSHSVPQIVPSTASAPIPIPPNPRVISPAHSPSPIPQPAASGGGRPPTGLSTNGMTFGSLPGDGDRQMRPSPIPQGPVVPTAQPSHDRRGSGAGDAGLGSSHRGGFPQQGGRGGRGGYNANPSYPAQQMGYPGANNQFRGPPTQGRGGMAPQFNNRGGPMQQYPNSPHQPARSPALASSMPGTPNMGQAMPMQPPQQYGGYPSYHMGGPQVHHPSTYDYPPVSFKQGKNNKYDRFGHQGQQGQQKFNKPHLQPIKSREQYKEHQRELFDHTLSSIEQKISERSERSFSSGMPSGMPFFPPFLEVRPPFGGPPIDLSPESGNFEKILTNQQNFAAYPAQAYDRMTGMPLPPQYTMYPQMQYMQGMQGPPQSPQPNFQQPYSVGQYNQPQPQSMSRTPSQLSERPNSSLGQPQTPSMPPSTASAHTPQPKAAPAPSPAFQRTARKSAAIVIKNADGEIIQLPTNKPPASPAPSNRSRTPDVVTSAPTPPPKSLTPQQPSRSDSPAIKTQEQIRLEFKEQMKKAAEADIKVTDTKMKDDEGAAATESTLKEEVKIEETKPEKEDMDTENSKAAEDAKAAADAEAAAAEAAATAAAAAAAVAAAAAAAAAKAKQDEEDELERQIQEMEEADARREKEEAERMAKRAAEKAAFEKENAEKNKLLAAENDRKLREQEREMERLEDEREKKRLEAEAKAAGDDLQDKADTEDDAIKDVDAEVKLTSEESLDSKREAPSTPNTLAAKLSNMNLGGGGDSGASTPASDDSMGPPPKVVPGEKRSKPAALNLAPLNTKPIEPPQPSAALQSLKSARFLTVMNSSVYPPNINSPNPALNSAVTSKGRSFKYDKEFLLQFQKVFTEKPSLEFESQIKALIGDGDGGSARPGSSRTPGGMGPRQPSNRKPPGEFLMGHFGAGAVGGKTLPPGTTSDQRFAISQGTLPRPTINNPMASFNRPFPSSNPMQRVPSSSNMGSMPQSPRNQRGNNSQRQGSKRDYIKDAKLEAQAAKTMPLTAGMDVKPIHISASGWKPRTVMGASSVTGAAGPAPGDSGHMQPEMVQRKVKAALNKMTPEKFDKIADQILTIAAQSKDEADGRTLRQVIQLTFEKATDEAHWASMYAKFCKRMLETMSPDIKDESILDKNGNVVSGGNLFRKYLLNRCQEEFERGWKTHLGDKPEGNDDGEEKNEEAAMLSDAYYIEAAAKRRGLGLVQFIGELYKLGMLTERIMHECVKKLVDYTGVPDEAEIESLTKLLKTIGGNLDSTEKGKPMMDVYFTRIQGMIDTPELPSRLKFMLMDIVDLRRNHWHSKEDNKGPKTLEEVRQEAEEVAKQKAQETARSSRGGGGGGSGRMQIGRGDSRNFSGGYGNQPPIDFTKNTVTTDDLRRLGNKGASRQAGGATMSFGPSSMFSSQSRSNSGKGKMGPGGSLSRTGEDSGASSRTGTPPQQKEKEPATSVNAFSLLEGLNDSNETENPVSPPAAPAASPELSKVTAALAETLDKAADDKKESDS